MQTQVVEKENKEQRNLPLFILKIVGNVIFYLVIISLLLFSIMNIRAGNRNDNFPNIFGKGFLSVQSNSMNGDKEDSFAKGDLLIVSVFKEKDYDKLQVGDIITFYDPEVNNGQGGLNSHRIVYIKRDADGHIISLAAQGDLSVKDYNWTYNPDDQTPTGSANNQALISTSGAVQTNIAASRIRGVQMGIWRGAGTVMDNLQKYWLFIFVLPVLLFLIFEVFMVVKNIMALKGEKQKAEIEQAKDELAAQKEELRAQILAELKAEQLANSNEKNVEEAPTEPVAEEVVEPVAVEEIPAEPMAEEGVESVAVEEAPAEPVVEEMVESVVVTEEVPANDTPKNTTAKKTTTARKTTSTVKKTTTTTKKTATAKKNTASKSTTSKTGAQKEKGE